MYDVYSTLSEIQKYRLAVAESIIRLLSIVQNVKIYSTQLRTYIKYNFNGMVSW